MRRYIALLLVLLPFTLLAQDIERTLVTGVVSAPKGDDIEGINIYNSTTQKGTVTDKEGEFQLQVGINDRVLVTALQFQSFTIIVDKGVIESETMNIYLNPAVNQLEEVIVRPYDLSGNIVADVNRVKTYTINPTMDLSYEALNFKYNFSADALTKVDGNAAEQAINSEGMKNGLNIKNILKLIFKGKEKQTTEAYVKNSIQLSTALRQRFSNAYIFETFNISENKADDFLHFVEDSGLTTDLLQSHNELKLLEYMFRQSQLYKEQRENK